MKPISASRPHVEPCFQPHFSVQVQLSLKKTPTHFLKDKGSESLLTSLDSAIPEEASNGLHTSYIYREFVFVISSASNCYS